MLHIFALRRTGMVRAALLVAGIFTLGAGFLLSHRSVPATHAAGPPPAATANVITLIGPDGGSISGFGITATFAAGAVSHTTLIILGNWPNGLDVPPPNGATAVKTFSLQACLSDGTNCTSAFGDYPNSPAGTEKIAGNDYPYTGFQNVLFGTATNKLVTITIQTAGTKIYIYNPNFQDTVQAYPKLLPSASTGTTLTFQTFRPIVWTVTVPAPTPASNTLAG